MEADEPQPPLICVENRQDTVVPIQIEDEVPEVRRKHLKSYTPSWAVRPVKEEKQFCAPKTGRPLEIDPPPFIWAGEKRATVRSMEYLLSLGIETITGTFICKKCKATKQVAYDLRESFSGLKLFIQSKKAAMNEKAPKVWMNRKLETCEHCGKVMMKPKIAPKKRNINWLFMLLGQKIAFCSKDQMKYLCKHVLHKITYSRPQLIYCTYFALCEQLEDDDLFKN